MGRKGKFTEERQAKIMEFLEQYQEENSYAPSIREIGSYIGVPSTSLVDYYLRQLIKDGYIERNDHVSRSLRILKHYGEDGGASADKTKRQSRDFAPRKRDVVRFPVLGRIVASAPIPLPNSDFAYFDEESYIEIPRQEFSPYENLDDLFVLEVSGNSMIDAMINDGDKVVFRRTNIAHNGDMVAVWLSYDEETTLKYFYNEGDRVRLQPANPTMGPIYINNPEQVQIMGKVVMVIRHL